VAGLQQMPAHMCMLLPAIAFSLWRTASGDVAARSSILGVPLRFNSDGTDDNYNWLEHPNGSKQLAWVRDENQRTIEKLGNPELTSLMNILQRDLDITSDHVLEMQSSRSRPDADDFTLYSFAQGGAHIHGVWRSVTLSDYKPETDYTWSWRTVFDLDALVASEGIQWVFRGCDIAPRGFKRRCLMHLSRGGSDEVVEVREYNLKSRRFVDGGFVLAQAGRTRISWIDADRVFVGTQRDKGSITGQPFLIREWKRGTPLDSADLVFSGESSDVSVDVLRSHERRGLVFDMVVRRVTTFTAKHLIRFVAGAEKILPVTRWPSDFWTLPVPDDAEVSTFGDQVFLKLNSDYSYGPTIMPQGSLIRMSLHQLLFSRTEWVTLFRPNASQSLVNFVTTKNYILLNVLSNVCGQLLFGRYNADGIEWTVLAGAATAAPPSTVTYKISALDPIGDDRVWVTTSSFLLSPKQYLVDLGKQPAIDKYTVKQKERGFFQESGHTVSQHWAASKDGTPVPYFLVRRTHGEPAQPTLLHAYGGFGVSLTPEYSDTLGQGWLEKGGNYVLANIRGGGEFGPAWHSAGHRENKQRSYEDLAAVAKDIVSLGVTTEAMLGMIGQLPCGNMFVQYPELFGAIVCPSPLLDMKRYTKLGPQASCGWMEEYGDPNTDNWAYMKSTSPLHNLSPKKEYPKVLFMTSTRDDRVGPGHARKMVAKLSKEVPGSRANTFFYEASEGGSLEQKAFTLTLQYSFLWKMLTPLKPSSPPKVDADNNTTYITIGVVVVLALLLVFVICVLKSTGMGRMPEIKPVEPIKFTGREWKVVPGQPSSSGAQSSREVELATRRQSLAQLAALVAPRSHRGGQGAHREVDAAPPSRGDAGDRGAGAPRRPGELRLAIVDFSDFHSAARVL